MEKPVFVTLPIIRTTEEIYEGIEDSRSLVEFGHIAHLSIDVTKVFGFRRPPLIKHQLFVGKNRVKVKPSDLTAVFVSASDNTSTITFWVLCPLDEFRKFHGDLAEKYGFAVIHDGDPNQLIPMALVEELKRQ
jgi:hypothetical protein